MPREYESTPCKRSATIYHNFSDADQDGTARRGPRLPARLRRALPSPERALDGAACSARYACVARIACGSRAAAREAYDAA